MSHHALYDRVTSLLFESIPYFLPTLSTGEPLFAITPRAARRHATYKWVIMPSIIDSCPVWLSRVKESCPLKTSHVPPLSLWQSHTRALSLSAFSHARARSLCLSPSLSSFLPYSRSLSPFCTLLMPLTVSFFSLSPPSEPHSTHPPHPPPFHSILSPLLTCTITSFFPLPLPLPLPLSLSLSFPLPLPLPLNLPLGLSLSLAFLFVCSLTLQLLQIFQQAGPKPGKYDLLETLSSLPSGAPYICVFIYLHALSHTHTHSHHTHTHIHTCTHTHNMIC